MTTPVRSPAAYVHGVDAPIVVVPARVAAWLERHARLGELHAGNRGADPEVDAVLVALVLAARAWRMSATGRVEAAPTGTETPSRQMNAAQAAEVIGVSDRSIRRAITTGRLPARKVATCWVIEREDVEHYRAGHRAAA